MPSRRLLVFRAVLLVLLLLQSRLAARAAESGLALAALLPSYALCHLVIHRVGRERVLAPWLHVAAFLMDVLVTTTVLYVGDGLLGEYFAAYFVVLFASCFLQRRDICLVVGGSAAALYGVLSLPVVWAGEPASPYALRIALLLTTGGLSALIAESARKAEEAAAARYERRLEWLERLSSTGRAVAGVLHDARTPMSTVVLGVDALRRVLGRPGREAEAREQLELVGSEAEQAVLVLEDFLDFAAPADLPLAPLDAREPLGQALEALRLRLPSRRIRLEADLGGPAAVRGSGRHLRRLFQNLLINAWDAMPSGGVLHVRLREAAGVAEIRVRDTGRGIDPAALPGLFEPFVSERADGGGRGLGLHVARWIAAKHHGTLRLESPGPGKGATAVVRLPSRSAVPPAALAASTTCA